MDEKRTEDHNSEISFAAQALKRCRVASCTELSNVGEKLMAKARYALSTDYCDSLSQSGRAVPYPQKNYLFIYLNMQN